MVKVLRTQKILLEDKDIKSLQRDYGVSRVTIWRALRYSTSSDLAKAIRRDAIEKYNGVDTKVPTLV